MRKIINKNEKGITLIALVITIIVLLILAGVAISMLAGENGIINKTNSAKTENETATVEEQVKLAVMAALAEGNGKIEGAGAFKVLNDGLKDAGYNAEIPEDVIWPVILEIGENKYTLNKDGTIKQESGVDTGGLPIIKAGDYASKKSKYIDSNNKIAIIPEGFTVSNIKTDTIDETTINNGLVIYKGDLSKVEDMTTCKTTNDQFVWIPVDDPSTMYGTKENGEYYGKLYDFKSDGTIENLNWYKEVTQEEIQQAQEKYDTELSQILTQISQAWEADEEAVKQMVQKEYGITITTIEELEQAIKMLMGPRPTKESVQNEKREQFERGRREPDYLVDTEYGDASTDDKEGLNLLKSIVGIEGTIGTDNEKMLEAWKKQLQNEYKEMIESVVEYGGFYVARYETSLKILEDGTHVAQSIADVESASTFSSSANTWYGLYQKEKEYSTKNSLTNIVGSTMIWGSQYDQMMLWMKANSIDVTATDPNRLKGAEINPSATITGGEGDKDILNNVYDLLGCKSEYTLEANYTNSRIYRGGTYAFSYSPSYRLHFMTPCENTNSSYSSRVSLYIK